MHAAAGRSIRMRRRDFIGLVGAVSAWPQSLLAQAARRRPLIGRLGFNSKDDPFTVLRIGQFFAGMRELGHAEGRDFDMVYRFADFHADRLPQVAAEMVRLAPDVILVGATVDAVAAAKATATIQLLFLRSPIQLNWA